VTTHLPYLDLVRRESDAIGALLTPGQKLAAPVPHCGDWTLRDLVEHMGKGNHWAAAAITEKHGRYDVGPAPADDAELRAWYERSVEALMSALATDPEADAWTFWRPRTVGFWRRRRAQETLIHRWDAQNALGEPDPLDPALAADGVAEVFDTMAPRQVKRERIEAPRQAVALRATDTGQSWSWGPGEPVAELSGTAEALLLALWKRLPADAPGLAWAGDRAAGQEVLAAALTP